MDRTSCNNNATAKTSTTNAHAVGILDMQMDTQLKSTTHKGEIMHNAKAGTIILFTSKIDEDFDFTKTKAMHVAQKYFHSYHLASVVVCFKKSTGSSRKTHVPLEGESFTLELTRCILTLISNHDVSSCTDGLCEVFAFEIYQ